MKDLKVRRLVLTFVPVAAVLALVLGLSSLSTGTASAQAAYPTNGPTVSVTSTGGSCAMYDSWCAYCSMNASAQCDAFVPAHTVGDTARGAQGNSGNEPVMGVTAGCACGANVAGAYNVGTSMMMTTAMYGPAMYGAGLDVGGSWTWCATANMNAGSWVPSALVGTALC